MCSSDLPVWDIWELLRGLDPQRVGACFDIGHATLEGGYSWPSTARLMEPHLAAVFVKDFVWKKGEKGWKAECFDFLATFFRRPIREMFRRLFSLCWLLES